jgi:apolipoprotein N-acyltransferase
VEITARWLNQPADASASPSATTWVFGTTTWRIGDDQSQRYNAALLVGPQGDIRGRYYKMHPVIFGEYVPFGDIIPSLYNLFPLPNGLTPGREPAVWEVEGLRLSPSICFESTIPHLLRRHVATLARQGQSPDVLINLTNDGWFWGSSILDLQLHCAILQAVELRRPFVIAANTGFSAWIDSNGAVLAQGRRRATDVLLAEVGPDDRRSGYEIWGDGPVLCCTLLCLLVAGSGIWNGWRRRGGGTRAEHVTPASVADAGRQSGAGAPGPQERSN